MGVKQISLSKYEEHELRPSIHGDDFDRFLTQLSDSESRKIRDQAYNMSCCQKSIIWMNNGDFGQCVELHQTCNNRSCPHCAKLRATRNNISLKDYIHGLKSQINADNLRFVTLTYENVSRLSDFKFKNIPKDMIKFKRKLKSFGYYIHGGYRVLEITYKEDKGFHIHLHLLYYANVDRTENAEKKFNKFVQKYQIEHKDSNKHKLKKNKLATYDKAFSIKGHWDGYIDYKVLNYIWADSNHLNSFVTYPVVLGKGKGGKKIKGNKKINAGINYLTKYMTKGFFDPNYSIEVNVEIYTNTKTIRYFQKFGQMFQNFSAKAFSYQLFYKEDVVMDDHGNWIPKITARIFYFGLNVNCDFIAIHDIRFVRYKKCLKKKNKTKEKMKPKIK